MSAVLQPDDAAPLRAEPMRLTDLDAVQAIEASVYAFPWTRGNFVDSLAAGYDAHLLRSADGQPCAYAIAMDGVQEVHLLNLTVAPGWQHAGLARTLLARLVERSREAGARWLWLEVRRSNLRARQVYARYGFEHVADRPAYYPAAGGQREDACVMRLVLRATSEAAGDALD